jgi:hypothetical protein
VGDRAATAGRIEDRMTIEPNAAPKPVSIFDALAIGTDGQRLDRIAVGELSRYLQTTLGTREESERNARHAKRDALYRDGGVAYMRQVIDEVFDDNLVREKRKKWVEHARFSNPLKRVVNELSTVYAEPAKRVVSNDAAQKKYDELLELVQFDEQMLQLSRLLNLHRAMLVGFRVRVLPNGTRAPIVDMASPADVRVVMHPNDNKLPIGWIVRAGHRPVREVTDDRLPKWTLWTDVERMSLRDDMSIIGGTIVEHGLGVCPWVPVLPGPIPAGFWPGEEGEDLVAARVSSWLSSIFLLKEQKSATKQPVLQGDGTNIARSQAADSEVPIETADGQSITTVDMSMDLGMFRATSDHIIEHVAQDYGMSAALINQQGVQSAEARELMRVPLRELRKHQQIPLRRFERDFAKVMAQVLSVDLPSMAFDPAGWRIEFGESQTPLSRADRLNLFLAERTAGVSNTVEYLEETRGMDVDQSLDHMIRCQVVEFFRHQLMRPLMAASGAAMGGAPQPAAIGTPSVVAQKDVLEEDADENSNPTSLPVPPRPQL